MLELFVNLDTERRLLGERLLKELEQLHPALREDVTAALAVEGKLLHRPASPLDGRWALLPFCLARELRAESDPEYARGVGLAMEYIICATDLFDDVMDDDVTPLLRRLGTARALNVALALVSLVQRALLSLARQGFPPALLTRMLDTVQRSMLLASSGQQQDLLAERRPVCELTREDCIEIAAAKAGALLSLACQLGALCADVEERQLKQCAEMGRLLGIAAQLDNDAHDLFHLLLPLGQSSRNRKSDLARGKKTLPVVLAAHSLREMRGIAAKEIDRAFREIGALAGEERARAVSALREGVLATWGVALLYRERARDYLRVIEQGRPVSPVLLQVLGFDEPSENGR
jgi:geranylgeranyl diphosphate synthase type I